MAAGPLGWQLLLTARWLPVCRLAATQQAIQQPSNRLLAPTELDSNTWISEVKRIRGKKHPPCSAGLHALRDEYARTIEPARALATETLNLERKLKAKG
jgi:hypothetical protein